MDSLRIRDPLFRDAVAAGDRGDVSAVERLLAAHPRLVRERVDGGEGYFRDPYLLWFVAENPARNGTLPASIARVTRAIVRAAARQAADSLREQLDYALALVGSGRVARECGVQRDLIDVLLDAGAEPAGALVAALAHRELAAAEQLLGRRRHADVAGRGVHGAKGRRGASGARGQRCRPGKPRWPAPPSTAGPTPSWC